MEIKKSTKADLEHRRPQWFMLGLCIALALLLGTLYFPFTPSDPLEDPELLELLSSDEELAPFMRQENEVLLAPKAEPKPAAVLTIVEEEEMHQEEEEEPERTPEQPLEGDVADDLPEETPQPSADEVVSFRVVEDLPQFPGGYAEFMKWLTRNLRYPPIAREKRMQGKVIAEFIVNKDGSVTDVAIVKSLNTYCDHEALRVLRMMPRWTAGIQNDKPCRTKVCIPIVFRL